MVSALVLLVQVGLAIPAVLYVRTYVRTLGGAGYAGGVAAAGGDGGAAAVGACCCW